MQRQGDGKSTEKVRGEGEGGGEGSDDGMFLKQDWAPW